MNFQITQNIYKVAILYALPVLAEHPSKEFYALFSNSKVCVISVHSLTDLETFTDVLPKLNTCYYSHHPHHNLLPKLNTCYYSHLPPPSQINNTRQPSF